MLAKSALRWTGILALVALCVFGVIHWMAKTEESPQVPTSAQQSGLLQKGEIFSAGGADMGMESSEQGVIATVREPGSADWNAQFRVPVEIVRGHRYRIRIELASETAQLVPLWVQQQQAAYEFQFRDQISLPGGNEKIVNESEFVASMDEKVFIALALGGKKRSPIAISTLEISDGGAVPNFEWRRSDAVPGTGNFTPRLEFGRRLEPQGTVLHGAGQDPGAFADYVRALDSPSIHPVLYMDYAGLYEDWSPRIKRWSADFDEIEKTTGKRPSLQLGLYLLGSLEKFNQDASDADLERIAEDLRQLNAPVFLRIGYEPNGAWNAYQPEAYKKAFRRIATFLRERLPNLAVVWCIVAQEGGTAESMRWYPGDDVTDWWGIDLFSVSDFFHPQTKLFLEEAEKHRFPVMIGEATPRYIGVTPAAAAWQRWFVPYFSLMRQQPVIKASSYINWNWPVWSEKIGIDWKNWGDARIETSPDLLPLLRDEYKIPLYQHLAPQEKSPDESKN